MSCEYSLILYL